MRPRNFATVVASILTTIILVHLYRNPTRKYDIDDSDRIIVVDDSDRLTVDDDTDHTYTGEDFEASLDESTPTWKYPPLLPELDHSPLSLEVLPAAYHTHFPSHHLPTTFDTPPLRNLARRLDAFLRRPVLSYEEAREANEAGCPLRLMGPMVPIDQVENESAFWKALSKKEIVQRRVDIVGELNDMTENMKEVVWEGGRDGGRGIVLTGGNAVSYKFLG